MLSIERVQRKSLQIFPPLRSRNASRHPRCHLQARLVRLQLADCVAVAAKAEQLDGHEPENLAE